MRGGFAPTAATSRYSAASSGSTDLANIWRYQDFGTGFTVGNTPTASWMGLFGTAVVSNTFADLGTTSMRLDAFSGNTSFGYYLALPTNLVEGDTLWFSARMYRPTGYSDVSAGGHLKFYRFHTFTSGAAHGGYIDMYLGTGGGFHFIYEGTQGNYGQPWVPDNNDASGGFLGYAPTTGVWETYDMCAVMGHVPKDSGGLAEVWFWKGKNLVGHVTSRETMTLANYTCSEIHHTTYWNNGAPQNESLYIGRFAVAAKIAGVRDDTNLLTTDTSGNRLIAVGY